MDIQIVMDTTQLSIVVAVFFLAAFAKGITGLGFSTTALPFLVVSLGLMETLPLLLLPSMLSNLLVMRQARNFRLALKRFWPLYLASLPGIALGLVFLTWLDPLLSAACLGAILISYCLFALARPNFSLSRRLGRNLMLPCGLINGTVNGLTGSQVMPMTPYMLALRLPDNLFLQAVNISFTLSSIAMGIGLYYLGLFTVPLLLLSAFGLLPVFMGVQAGGWLRNKLAPGFFRLGVLAVLLVMGASMAARPWL